MKKLKRVLIGVGCVAALSLSAGNLCAQNGGGAGGGAGGGGGGGMAQFRQGRIDRMRDAMEVKDDAEWKVISESIGKVMDAQMEALAGRMGGMRGNRGGNNGGGGGGGNGGGNNGGGNNRRGGFGGTPSAEAEDLQKALDAKASPDEIKTKLAKLRDANKAGEAKLDKAQEDLRKLLTARQEAVAVLNGVLK